MVTTSVSGADALFLPSPIRRSFGKARGDSHRDRIGRIVADGPLSLVGQGPEIGVQESK
jgi:hypothetical protein